MKLYAPTQEEARQGAEAATDGMMNQPVANGIKPPQDQSPSGKD